MAEVKPIGVDSLGAPGEIVVMPPTKRRNEPNPQHQTAQDRDRIGLEAILDDVEEEISPLAMSTVHAQIESYYPSGRQLTSAAWEHIRSNLAASFTAVQLRDYITLARSRNRASGGGEDPTGKWRPGTSPSWHTPTENKSTDRFPASSSQTQKSLLAERILRSCWQLSIVDEPGQLDLPLATSVINLLLCSKNFSFDQVASLHNSTIDITNALGLVQITGWQNSCESIRDIILDASSRICQIDVGFGLDTTHPGLDQVFNPPFLAWVAETYGVFIEQGPSRLPKRILYLAENKRAADDARRTLYLAISHAKSAPVSFSTYLPASEMATLHRHTSDTTLAWIDRQKQWFRWSMPAVQSAEVAPSQVPFFDNHQTRLSSELLKFLRSTPVFPGLPERTADNTHESVTAAIGRCLFTRKSFVEGTRMNASELGKLSTARTFTADIPRLIPFLDSLTLDKDTSPGSQPHRLRLLPSSTNPTPLPELDVLFTSSSSANLLGSIAVEVQSVKLVFGANHVDYLLPENGLDLRFTRKVYHEILDGEHPNLDDRQSLLNSIGESLRGLFTPRRTADGPVPLPLFITLPLPGDALQGTGSRGLGTSAGSNAIEAEYIFPPLRDIQQSAFQRYNFGDRQLSCSFYDLSPFLPSQAPELSSDLKILGSGSVHEQDPSLDALDEAFHSFYNASCEMAFGAHATRTSALGD